MEVDISTILRQLRARRLKLGFTQARVALLGGLAQSYVSAIEKGKIDPRVSTLQDLARALRAELVLVPNEDLLAVRSLLGMSGSPAERRLFEIEPD